MAGSASPEDEPAPDLDLLVPVQSFVAAHGSDAHEWRSAPIAEGELGSIMYTSGTTGDPKGVMIRQSAVLENLRAGVARVHFTPRDRILGVLPLFHVLPLITNCLGPLYIGARVVFLRELTAEAIMAAFRRHRITVFVCVPAFFYRFHDRVRQGLDAAPGVRRHLARTLIAISAFARRRLNWSLGRLLLGKVHAPFGRQMRLFITGGAKINAQVFDDFLDWGFCLGQGYGLTEATAIVTATPLDELRGDTVGRPIEGVELRIDEPDHEGIGEVWVRGPSLMSGYYRNPEATAAALRDGWLLTGDLGRIEPDGHLKITGRAKDVIVLASGKNIYPDELEGHYGKSDLVEEMCIVGVPDQAGRGERLHAVVVPDLDAARRRGYVNVREMIKWDLETLGAQLPAPQRLTSLEIRHEPLPRTPTRKIKRFVVLQQVGSGTEVSAEIDERPDAGSETSGWTREVEALVARFAQRDAVRPQDHLDLDLGLESLDRIELLSELELRHGIELDEEAAGRVHTVAELIEAVAASRPGGAGGEAVSVDTPAESGDERWRRVLAQGPEGLQRQLRRRPFLELGAWLLLRTVRVVWRLLAGFRVSGAAAVPSGGGFIICANHASYLDPFLLCMALPRETVGRVFFVGYSEYFQGPVGSRLGRLFRNLPIDPNRNLERAMQAAAFGLRQEMVLVIFPEGGRSLDGTLREFRRGAAILSRHLSVPLVPAGIWGAHRAWGREERIRRHPISIAFGTTVETGQMTSDEELTAALRGSVAAALEEACDDGS